MPGENRQNTVWASRRPLMSNDWHREAALPGFRDPEGQGWLFCWCYVQFYFQCHNRVIFKQLLQAKALQFLQIDSCRLGSVNENLSVLLMAKKFESKGAAVAADQTFISPLIRHLPWWLAVHTRRSLQFAILISSNSFSLNLGIIDDFHLGISSLNINEWFNHLWAIRKTRKFPFTPSSPCPTLGIK